MAKATSSRGGALNRGSTSWHRATPRSRPLPLSQPRLSLLVPVAAALTAALAALVSCPSRLLLGGSRTAAAFAGPASRGLSCCRGDAGLPGLPPRRSSGFVPPRRRCACAAETDTRLYDVLGISKDASVREIKKAYYREAKTAHPDLAPGDEEMFNRFQEVAEAYQTLADPVRRQQYDLQGLAGLAYFKTNATRLFGPPPWQVLLGKTDHWLWAEEKRDHMIKLLGSSIPNGISGVTMKTIAVAYDEAFDTNVAVLLERVSEEQAKDTVEELEEYGLAVKAEPLEGERSNEKESPIMYFRRIQRELGEAAENLRQAAIEFSPEDAENAKSPEAYDADMLKWVDMVKSLRSELRAAALELEEFKLSKVK